MRSEIFKCARLLKKNLLIYFVKTPIAIENIDEAKPQIPNHYLMIYKLKIKK